MPFVIIACSTYASKLTSVVVDLVISKLCQESFLDNKQPVKKVKLFPAHFWGTAK